MSHLHWLVISVRSCAKSVLYAAQSLEVFLVEFVKMQQILNHFQPSVLFEVELEVWLLNLTFVLHFQNCFDCLH